MINNFFLRVLVFPIYVLFTTIVWIKNKLFDFKLISSFLPPVFTISVGNLAVGGTGKTPMVEYLMEIFGEKYKRTILSRGYGRETKGFFEVNSLIGPKIVGDEPYQYFLKYKAAAKVFVGENRVIAVKKILDKYSNTDLILLDDAFQHRQISAHLNLVLTDYNKPIYDDLMMPIGRLREPIESLNRADIVVVTKCDTNLSIEKADFISARILPFCKKNTPIFFTKIAYQSPIQFSGKAGKNLNETVLVTGLANSGPFLQYCKENWQVKHHFDFSDHHDYTENDIALIIKSLSANTSLLVTEKDYVKLKSRLDNEVLAYYLPIKTEILLGQKELFEQTIMGGFKKNKDPK